MEHDIFDLKAKTWRSNVEQSEGMMLVYFWTQWCGHCRMFSPVYSEVALEMAGKVRFGRLNCDEYGSVAAQCKVTGTPTVVAYIDGKEVDRLVGGLSKEALIAWLNLRLGR